MDLDLAIAQRDQPAPRQGLQLLVERGAADAQHHGERILRRADAVAAGRGQRDIAMGQRDEAPHDALAGAQQRAVAHHPVGHPQALRDLPGDGLRKTVALHEAIEFRGADGPQVRVAQRDGRVRARLPIQHRTRTEPVARFHDGQNHFLAVGVQDRELDAAGGDTEKSARRAVERIVLAEQECALRQRNRRRRREQRLGVLR